MRGRRRDDESAAERRLSAAADKVNDLDHVVRFDLNGCMLRPRHDRAISFDRYRAIGKAEMLHQTGESQPWRYVADFSVDGESHAAYVGATNRSCQ